MDIGGLYRMCLQNDTLKYRNKQRSKVLLNRIEHLPPFM